jgi:Zn-dependent protease with chaperone function
LLVIASALYCYLLMWLTLRPWRLAHNAHWTERARWLWLARVARFFVFLGAAAIGTVAWLERRDDALALPIALAVITGYFAASFFIDRHIEPRYTLRFWLSLLFWKMGIIYALLGTVVWTAYSTSVQVTGTDWLRIAVAAVIMSVIYSGVWLLLLPNRDKQPQTPRLRQIVDEVAAITGIGPVRAWVAESVTANAIALMYIRSIVVTSRAMEVLNDDELRTLVQHEMAHLRESVPVRCARLLGGLSWLGFAFTRPVVHRIDFIGVVWIFLGVMLVRKFTQNVAKRMENRADSMSATTDAEGPVYARALEKLYEANQMPAVMSRRLVHPHLYDRMTAAGLTPDYPRPAPPPKRHWTSLAALLPPMLWFFWLGFRSAGKL